MPPRRKPKRHRGREEVFKERFQMKEYWEKPESNEAEIGDILNKTLKNLGLARDHWLHTLANDWARIVGDHLAEHTRPGPFEYGILTIFVDHPIRLMEMKRFGEKGITEKLQAQYPERKFRRVRLSIDPEMGR